MGINKAEPPTGNVSEMGLRLLLLLLLGIFTVVFMDEDIRGPKSKWLRFCHDCDFYDGFKCRGPKKRCWKFNLSLKSNKSCTTDHYYYNDPITGRYLYRYTKLSCNPCEEGMFQVYHDLLRETFCCTDKHMCNTGHDILEKSALFGEDKEHTIHDDVLP